MSKFSAITRGIRAIDRVKLTMPDGQDLDIGVRALTGRELGEVLANARTYAIANGIKEPKDNDRLYELGQMAHTLALACIDPDSAEATVQVSFFASAEEILDGLDPDRIVFLYEQQQAWQDKCSPRASALGQGDFFAKVLECAGWKDGEPDPLALWRPTLRVSFTHTLAVQFLNCLTDKSTTSSGSGGPASSS